MGFDHTLYNATKVGILLVLLLEDADNVAYWWAIILRKHRLQVL